MLNVAELDFSGGVICDIDYGKTGVSLEAIARGLLYDKYKRPFAGELILFEPIFPAMGYLDGQPELLDLVLTADKQGDCSEVFWYQFLEHSNLESVGDIIECAFEWTDVAILKMCFFGCTIACVIFNRNGKNRVAEVIRHSNISPRFNHIKDL